MDHEEPYDHICRGTDHSLDVCMYNEDVSKDLQRAFDALRADGVGLTGGQELLIKQTMGVK